MVGALVLPTTFHSCLCTSNTLLERCSYLKAISSFFSPSNLLRLFQPSELADGCWDNLGIDPVPTDYIYITKSSGNGEFSDGSLQKFGNIDMNPSACVLNYGQGIIEGLKAYKKQDNSIVLFRPQENGLLMRMGADRLCMPAPTVEQFVEAVKSTVLANQRWIPPPNKGFLYIRPLLMGSGAVLSLTPPTEFTFLIYVTPLVNYFKECLKPLNVVIQNETRRTVPGGVGSIKAIGNYAVAQDEAKANGFSDVLYLDSVDQRYIEQASTSNNFVVKDKVISTPVLGGTLLPGVTRKSIIEIAHNQGFQVEERHVSVEELFEADEVFFTGSSVSLLPVNSITYQGERVSYGESGFGEVSHQLHLALSNLQMGLTQDIMDWTVILNHNVADDEYADVEWDNLGFGIVPTDYIYIMKCSKDNNFEGGQLCRYGNIQLSPAAAVLSYGQGIYEGTKVYRKEDGRLLMFRPDENAIRMRIGAERMCMPSPSIHQFVNAIKQIALANKRWVPPTGKGSLYIRPILIGSGPALGLAPAPEYTFLVYASPVCNYFKEGFAALNLYVEDEYDRASRGGTGGVKSITNYAPVLKAMTRAKNRGFSDVLYLDSVNNKFVEEVSSCNVFIVKDNVISTPPAATTILAGITRKSVIEIAGDHGYQVEERSIGVNELMEADEVFCTGTAVGVAPVGSITYKHTRKEFKTGIDAICPILYSTLMGIKTGIIEDNKGWVIVID
ncbi:hypothetical protein FNV43_RR12675 [Rhamnella rubrinervis]|uniref:Branched-chain-amino-acid aminotransferase n=1 Tax=Rhamnella rubrinervis TaxID=2594499 RepID=A0A8K0H8B1_9ROSA|nr:hypothetical protein FNV43_RR12675 [Rhamnella rubrinervis]